MCLIDISTGFRTIREAMEELVGPVSKTILYNAGSGCGHTFTARTMREGFCAPREEAFTFSVESYSLAGFGAFEIQRVDRGEAHATVVCRDPPAFEAYPFLQANERSTRPVCDYSRGVMAGFLSAAFDRHDLLGCETSCRAKGDPECVFIIGEEREIMRKELATVSDPRSTHGGWSLQIR
jgi:predicted hydrocarbon binding protein